MKVKICGLTKVKNTLQIVKYNIDAIGLVFYPKSSRVVSISKAQDIIKILPPFINRVALFVNQSHNFIDEVLNKVPIDTIQFHGNESPKECEKYQIPYIKAVAMNTTTNLSLIADNYHYASGLLLDTPTKSFGGSGESFDWSLITPIDKPIILAGGLNSDNISTAIKQVNPYAVDVSSGVELQKGIKDINKVKQFLLNCK